MTLNEHNLAKKELNVWLTFYQTNNIKLYNNMIPQFNTFNNNFFNQIENNLRDYTYGTKILIIRPGHGEIIFFICKILCNNGFKIEKFWNDIYISTDFSFFDKNFKNEDTELIYIYRNNNLNKFDWKYNMKFDKIFMNPPYNYNLHLQIIQYVIAHVLNEDGECINLSPVRWLEDPLSRDKQDSDFKKFEYSVSIYIHDLDIILAEDANKLFNISWGDLGVYTFKKSIGNYNYKKLSENSIVEKIKNFALQDNVNKYATKEGPKQNYIGNFGIINSHYGDLTKFVSSNKSLWNYPRYTNTSRMITFNNDIEMNNFFTSNLCDTLRYYAYCVKKNQRQPWQLIPWLGNTINPRTNLKGYASNWIDEDFIILFNFTKKEQEIIKNTVKIFKKENK